MKCPSSTLACECRRCRDARRAAAWKCAWVMFLIWCFGFVAACAVIGHCFLQVP